jgi:hypothetical protein
MVFGAQYKALVNPMLPVRKSDLGSEASTAGIIIRLSWIGFGFLLA